MKTPTIIFLSIGILSIIAAAFYFNMQTLQKTPSAENRTITATFYPFYFFANEIAGDTWTVRSVVPSNVEPHDYEPTAKDIQAILSSDIFIHSGLGFEGWAHELEPRITKAGGAVIAAADPSDAHEFEESHHEEHAQDHEDEHHEEEDEHNHDGVDPHIWLSPHHAEDITHRIAEVLRAADPARAAEYTEREEQLTARLEELHESYETGLSQCAHRTLVTSHAAFGYLAEEYNLTQVSIAGLTPHSEPSPRTLADITTLVESEGITHIFMEELGSPRFVETIARETGATILELSPIEGVQEGEDYFSKMKSNLENLRVALQCN